ncbi:MAG: hypothetical protein Q8K64_12735 [Sediminibacterium sp.]|nr:hypothetical protein [Sediminibacterium sp.]
MKKIILASILLIGSIAATQAQISVNVNLGAQPNWGPVGYDRVEYYYLPEYEAYYYVPSKQFYYQNGNSWINASRLPSRFGNINLFNTYKVVVNEPRPYMRHIEYRNKYDRNRGWKAPRQVIIRDNRNYRDERFRNDRDDDHRENGKGHGNGKGKNKRGGDRDD